ncbi:hypothetical protein F220043C3_17520 [Enterocloster asparagiformis]
MFRYFFRELRKYVKIKKLTFSLTRKNANTNELAPFKYEFIIFITFLLRKRR